MTEMRAALIRLRDERFGGNQSKAAKALGVSHCYLSQAINGRAGCGKRLCLAYAALTGTSIDEAFRMAEGPTADPRPAPGPVESRKASPDLWRAYDDAGHLALKLRAWDLAVIPPSEPDSKPDEASTARAAELFDLLRTLLRERIEAEASGKAVSR